MTKTRGMLAHPAPTAGPRPRAERASPELLDTDAAAQQAYVAASARVLKVLASLGGRWYWTRRRRESDSVRELTTVANQIIDLWNAGATDAELRQIPQMLDGVIDSLATGSAMRSLMTVDPEQQRVEGEETELQVLRLAREAAGERVAPELLEREADIGLREAALQMEKSRILRRQARSLRAGTMRRPLMAAGGRA